MLRPPSPTTSLRAATALGVAIAAAHPARAATAEDGIAGIEAKIRHLQAQIDQVQKGLAARRAEVQAANAAAAEARREARAANAAVAASTAGQRQFSGTTTSGGIGIAAAPNPYPVGAVNGLGGHGIETVGQQKASAIGEYGRFRLGGVTVTLGGFIDATAITRTRNEVADVTSSWNAIPYPQAATYHEPEFRGSARNSRLALLIEGQVNPVTRVSAYYESDFKVSGTTSNSNESNSYALGIREAFAAIDRTDWGFHFLGGQAWSLVTLNRIGIVPRQEQIPLTIDSGYVPGFNWTRNWQVRFTKDMLDHRLWAAISFESPLASYYVNSSTNTGTLGGTPNYVNAGGSLLNATANYSSDIAPDVIGKLAYDAQYGHYELYGVGRFFSDRVTSTAAHVAGRNNTVLAGGVGSGMVLPIAGPKLTFQASALVGQGIGRYGEAQLPDATIGSRGQAIPIPEAEALLGLVWHPTKAWDLYAYVGSEQEEKRSYNEVVAGKPAYFGYGNGYYSNAGCDTEGSALACTANTRGITQGTLGAWWRFLHGPFGTLQAGTQWSYTQRTAFAGTGATARSVLTPKTDDNIVMFSFRYLPFL